MKTLAADLTGRVFGRLTAQQRVGSSASGQALWRCLCACSKICIVAATNLKSGNTTSCGCRRREVARAAATRHGMSQLPEQGVWATMLSRCFNANCRSYRHYGGRGITVDPRWLGEHGYENFLEDMGRRPGPGYSIERKNNALGYSKENCAWATYKQQARNTRSNRRVTYDGREMCLAELAELTGVPYQRLRNRISVYGWSTEDAVSLSAWPRRDAHRAG